MKHAYRASRSKPRTFRLCWLNYQVCTCILRQNNLYELCKICCKNHFYICSLSLVTFANIYWFFLLLSDTTALIQKYRKLIYFELGFNAFLHDLSENYYYVDGLVSPFKSTVTPYFHSLPNKYCSQNRSLIKETLRLRYLKKVCKCDLNQIIIYWLVCATPFHHWEENNAIVVNTVLGNFRVNDSTVLSSFHIDYIRQREITKDPTLKSLIKYHPYFLLPIVAFRLANS